MCHKSFPPHAAFRRRQRRKRNNGRKTSPDAPEEGVRPELSCPAEMHILYTLRLPTSSGSQNIYIWGKLFSCNPFSEGEKYGIMTRWQTMFIGNSGVSCKGRCLFPCLRRGSVPPFPCAGRCPAMPRGTPHGETAEQNPPQPSDAHGAARKLPDVKNIFI